MDELKGEAFSSNVSESAETVAQESAKEEKVEEEGGSNNGDDIMVEVLGSHVYVDGICTTDGGGAPGNRLNDEVVGGQDAHIAASRGEDRSRTLDGEGEELISGGDGDAEILRCMQENGVKRNCDHDESDQLGAQDVPVSNSAEDKKQDTVANSASGQPAESTVDYQLANEVQSDKMDQLQIDKQGLSSGQQLVEIERRTASSEIHHTGFSNSEMVDLFSERSETHLTTEATLRSDTAKGSSIEEGPEFEEMVRDNQKVNFHRDQEVQDNEASVEMLADGTENTGYPFADSGDVDMQNNDLLSENCDRKNLVERDRQEILGDMDVTCSHSGGQDAVIGNEPHDHNAGQITNGDQEQDNHAEEESKKQTALTPDSPVELHSAKYQLPPEDGEFCVSDLVWGKVRSHPWWPGQIFNTSDASDMAMRHHKKDSFLVAYFGDRTFAWNDASLLKPFRVHFSAAEKQNKTETFQNAVNCALEEIFRRVELGLACSCSPKDIIDKIKFQVVENTGIRQESSVQDVSDRLFTAVSFEPDNLLKYIKGLAQFPCGEADKLDIEIAKAQLSALYCLRGYHPLPEFSSGRGLVEAETSIAKYEERVHSDNITDYPSPMDLDDEHVSSSRRNSDSQRGSYHKRKHDLKGGLYPSKRERSMSELMGEGFDSLDTDGSDGKPENMLASPSSKKRKVLDPFPDEVVEEGRRIISLAKVSHTSQPPKPSFKIGECISRVASQMTGSPSVLKGPGDRLQKLNGLNVDVADGIDFPSETYEDAIRKFSSSDQLLSELRLAASDPMKDFSFLNVVVSFFFDFRNSLVPDHIPAHKEGGKRKRISNSVIGSAETFEFEDMSDTYWTDRIVQNGSEEQLAHGNGRGQYQIVPVELEKPIQRGRKSKKRYADSNHDAAGQKPPGYVNERAPAELVLTFSELNSVPSEAKLSKMFRHFGPLKESETEVDWETSRARVVFRRCSDAEVALNSAEKFNIFGPVVVKYQLNYSISESFKASLYAPALPEETQLVTPSLDEHTPLFGSAHGDHNQLIVSTLAEDASFMVSTLADGSLPLPSSFGEENSYMTVTLAEETSNVTAHAGEGSFTITTTAHMGTFTAGISENGTVGRQILDISPLPYEQISDTNMSEQTARGSITSDVETQPGSGYFNEPTSTVCTSICELPCTDASASVREMSRMPTSASEQTFTITTCTSEEQLTCSMTSGMEESIDARTFSEQTFVDREIPGEQVSNITASLGEEVSDMDASLGQESTDARTFSEQGLFNREMPGEQSSNIKASLGEEASAMDASFGQESGPSSLSEGTSDTTLGKVASETSAADVSSRQEYSAGPTTSWVEVLTNVSGLDDKSDMEVKATEKTLSVCASQGEESVGVTVSLVREGTSVTFGEEPSSVHVISAGEEISAIPMVSGKKVSAVSAGSGEETSVVPVFSAVETSVVIETSIEEPSAATMVSGKETLAVIATMDEDRSAVPVTSGQETPAAPTITGEDLSVTPLTSCKDASAVSDEDLSAATMATGEETSAVPATTNEGPSVNPMESGQETSEVPPTTGENLSASLVASGEETSAGPATTVEDLAAAPVACGEETSAFPTPMVEDLAAAANASGEETLAVPATDSEDQPAVPMLIDDKTSAVHVGARKETAAAPVLSGEEHAAISATIGEDLSAVPMVTNKETSAASMVSAEQPSAVSATTGEALSAVPMETGNETSAALMVCGEETSAVSATVCDDPSDVRMLTEDETLIVPVNSGVEIAAVAQVSGDETSAVPVNSGVEIVAAARVSGEETSAVPVITSEDPSTVPVGSGETLAAPVVSGEETTVVPVNSDLEIAAAARVCGEETSAVPVITSEDASTVPVGSGETPAAPVVSAEETAVVPVASGEETPADSSKQPLVLSVIAGEVTSSVVVAAGEATSTITATNDGETCAVPSTSSGEQLTTVSDRGDQTIGTKVETLLFSATESEETLTVDLTSMVNPSSAEGILAISTSTGDGASSPLTTSTSAVTTSVKETRSTVTMTIHEASSTVAAVDEAALTVPMTLDERSSTVTAVSDMENASASTTQVEEYAT